MNMNKMNEKRLIGPAQGAVSRISTTKLQSIINYQRILCYIW